MKAGYSLVKEHATHFEISHPKDGVFKVAKKPLDERTMKRIRKLPKAMADGGEVEAPDADLVEPAAAPSALPTSTGLLRAEDNGPIADWLRSSEAPLATLVRGQTDFFGHQRPDYVPPQGAAPQPSPAAGEPSGAAAAEAPTMPQPSTAPSPAPAVTPPDNYVQDVNKSISQQRSGIQAAATAQQQGANDTAKIYEDQAKTLANVEKDYQTKLQAIDKENQQLQNDITNTKIDPSRVWNSTSTGNKVIAAIGIALSGIGSGLTGQQNMAMKVINDTIDRDIDAQKADLGKKQNLLGANLQKYGRLDAAVAATRANLLSTVQAQVGGIAAKTQGAVAQANAQQLIGQLGLQTSQLIHGIAQQSALAGVQAGQTEIRPEDVTRLPEALQKKAVLLPGGKVRFAMTDDDAKEVKNSIAAARPIQDELGRAFALMEKGGRTGWGTAADAEAGNIRKNLILSMNKLHDLNRLTEPELEMFKEMVPSPGAWREDKARAQLMTIQNLIDSKLNAEYGTRLIGHNPGGIAFKAK